MEFNNLNNDEKQNSSSDKDSKKISLEFALLIGSAFILSFIPIINIPFTWIMTFFHEISHGIAALITGGSVEKIHLHLRGSGLCYTKGGIRFIISNAGYIGAVLWGIMIYKMADETSHKKINILAIFLATLIAISAILYGRDIVTWIILLILLGLFISIIKLQEAYIMKIALKFIGTYVLLDAVRAPLYLIDGRHYGDGAKLADLTSIPEIIWVLLWFAIGIIGVLYLLKINKKLDR
ncbi:MAG: M50 family metallopeptidase [Pseudomonadota bacterium]